MYLWFRFSCAVPVTVPNETKWIKFNKDQVGYYRVNYELSEWKLLSEALSNKLNDFSTADRAHLLNDAFSLAEATQLDYGVALNLTRYLANETENVPWSVAATKLSGIRKLMSHTENYPKFLVSWNMNCIKTAYQLIYTPLQQYGHKLIKPLIQLVGWNVDDNLNKKYANVIFHDLTCTW